MHVPCIMAVQQTQALPPQYVEDLQRDLGQQLTATTAAPLATDLFAPKVAGLDQAQKGLEKLFKDIGKIFKKKDSNEDDPTAIKDFDRSKLYEFNNPASTITLTPGGGNPSRTFGPGENEEALDYYIRTGMHRDRMSNGTIDPAFIDSLTDEQKIKYGKLLGAPGEDYNKMAVINYEEVKDTDYSITSEEFVSACPVLDPS